MRRRRTHQSAEGDVEVHAGGDGEDDVIVALVDVVKKNSHNEAEIGEDNGNEIEEERPLHTETRLDEDGQGS